MSHFILCTISRPTTILNSLIIFKGNYSILATVGYNISEIYIYYNSFASRCCFFVACCRSELIPCVNEACVDAHSSRSLPCAHSKIASKLKKSLSLSIGIDKLSSLNLSHFFFPQDVLLHTAVSVERPTCFCGCCECLKALFFDRRVLSLKANSMDSSLR